jgi:TPR repeat protein
MKWLMILMFSTLLMADQYCDAFVAYMKKDFQQAKKILDPLAFKGNPKAQNLLALVNSSMDNDAASQKWFRSAAAKGDLKAAYNLGVYYYHQNQIANARKWMLKAEKLNVAKGALGFLYVNENLPKSKEYFYEASLAGDSFARSHLCALLLKKTTKKDEKYQSVCVDKELQSSYETGRFYASPKKYGSVQKAIYYLEYAAQHKDAKAMNLMGELLMKRNGPMDQDRALQYFLKASDQGNIDAKVNAAWLYYTGVRWTREPFLGKKMIEEALAQKNAKAQFYMGYLMLRGSGFSGGSVHKNVTKGREYIKSSAAQGEPKALRLLIKSTKDTQKKKEYQTQLKMHEKEEEKARAIHFLVDSC